jgi:hypothetical protein
MAGLASVLVPDRCYGIKGRKAGYQNGFSRNQFSDNTVVNFQAHPDCSILVTEPLSFQDLTPFLTDLPQSPDSAINSDSDLGLMSFYRLLAMSCVNSSFGPKKI